MKVKFLGLILAAVFFAHSADVSAMGRRPTEEPFFASQTPSAGPAVTLKFEDFIRMTLRRSEKVKAVHEEIKIARANTLQALGEAIGDGSFVMTHNFREEQAAANQGGGVGGDFTAAHRRERKFVFNQPLFQGFKSVGALLGAGSLKNQRTEEFEYSKEVLFVEAANAFYMLISAEKNLEILQESLQLFQDRVSELEEREKIGRSRPGEVFMAKAKMKILEARIAKARGAVISARSLAWFYCGVSNIKVEDEDPETFSETLDVDPANYFQIAEQRSDVAAARSAMKVAKQNIVVKQSVIWPKVDLNFNQYEKREGFQDGISWDALLTMSVPLYVGGDNIGQVLESKSDYRKAVFNFENIRREAVLEIEQAHQDWIASRQQHLAFEAAVDASRENFNYQKEDYSKNLVNNLEVLEALEEYLNIREEANGVFYAMKVNYWKFQLSVNSTVPEWSEQDAGEKKA